MVRSLDFLCQWHLAADASDRFSTGKTVSFLEARDLCFAVGGDHDDFVDTFVYAGFEEERDVIDHDCFWIVSCCLLCQPGLFAGDAGMDDSFEYAQLGSISKDDGTQGLAIDGAIGIEHSLSERVHDLSPCRFAGRYDVPRQLIGIDDDGAALLEHLGDGAFAGGNAACEADQHHGDGA